MRGKTYTITQSILNINKIILSIFYLFTIVLLLTSCGDNLKEPVYLRYSYEMIPIKSGDKWGYIDIKGNLAVNPQFKDARPFADGRAAVCSQDALWGYIDSTGNYIINPIYKHVTDFCEGYAVVVRPNGKPEMIDSAGNVKFNFNSAIHLSVSKGGLLRFEQDNEKDENSNVGYYGLSGKVAITAQFFNASSFSEGLANYIQISDEDTLAGFIDVKGKTVINPQFEWAGNFSDSLALIKTDGKYGYINKKGKIVINPQFDDAQEFHEGLAAIKMGDQWGYINKTGKISINPQFESARKFTNSLAAVKMSENKWGYIDTTGKYRVNPQFKAAGPFDHPNFAAVKIGEKIGFIDSLGKYVVNPQYDETYVWSFDDFMGDHNSIDAVHSDYIDYDNLISRIFDKNFENIKGYEFGKTQRQILDKHDQDEVETENGDINVALLLQEELFGGITITNLTYGFDGSLTSTKNVFSHSDYYYNYYDTKTVVNDGVKVNKVAAIFNMGYGVGYERQEELGEKIVKKLEKIFGTKSLIDDFDEIKSRTIKHNGKIYVIRWDELNHLLIKIESYR